MISRVSSSNFNRNVNFKGNLGNDFKNVADSVNEFINTKDETKDTDVVVGASAAAVTAKGASNVNKAMKAVKEGKVLKNNVAKEVAKHEENLSKAALSIGKAILKNPILSKVAATIAKPSLVKTVGKAVAKPLITGASILLVTVDLMKSISTTKDVATNAAKNIA